MAARKKPESEKQTSNVMIRVTPKFKERLDKMADHTGISTSESGRRCLERVLEKWEASQGT